MKLKKIQTCICGNNDLKIHGADYEIYPEGPWYIFCENCGLESLVWHYKNMAIKNWNAIIFSLKNNK